MKTFYTYIYQREDGTPYYVGKGRGQRAFSTQHYVYKPPRSRIVIQYWASEGEAFAMEAWYIKLFGRKDMGTGILRNRTDGGIGGTGWTQERRKWFSELMVKMPRRPHTEAAKRKIGIANAGKKGPQPQWWRDKIRHANMGHEVSETTRRRMSEGIAAHYAALPPRQTCRAGRHPWTEENIYHRPDGHDECNRCKQLARDKYNNRKKVELCGI